MKISTIAKKFHIKLLPGLLSQNCRFASSLVSCEEDIKSKYDAVIIGAGHNGLVSAAYLAKQGFKVAAFEKRHVIGGAAVTEEIVPGYKFSRASYVLSLLRPRIIKELELKKHGLKIYVRKVSSFTPLLEEEVNGKLPRYLCLSPDERANVEEIGKFSRKDAAAFASYEKIVLDIAKAVDPLLDNSPPQLREGLWKAIRTSSPVFQTVKTLQDLPAFYEFLTSPITKILDRWFETDVLKATLATDGIIGAMISPHTPGSSYVLLHHMLGEVDGEKGSWGFAQGGMGAVSNAIAKAAKNHGADIFVNQEVKELNFSSNNECTGITLSNGNSIQSKVVLSNATPEVTFKGVIGAFEKLPEEYQKQISSFDYTSPVTKINVAVNAIPKFTAIRDDYSNGVPDQLKGTIHLNCEDVAALHDAYMDAEKGTYSKRPMIEMCIPTSMDPTLAPEGHHVISLFTQYTPYYLNGTDEWTDQNREDYKDSVFQCIEDYAPGFKKSVVGYEVLTPMDLEKTFGLTGGNIFHGAIGLDQLFLSRPTSYMASHRTPIKGLYLCGSGTHPGGGVMGASGRLCAMDVISDVKPTG